MPLASPCFIPPHVNHSPDSFILTLLHGMCQRETSIFLQIGLRITRAIQAQSPQGMKHHRNDHRWKQNALSTPTHPPLP